MRERTEGGFLTSPVLASLGPAAPNAGLDIIAAGEDRHVYAWHADGSAVSGFPVLVEDPDKVASVNQASNEVTFNANAAATTTDTDEDQGKIVDTPAVAQLDGPGNPPSIIVGTNEEYAVNVGDEGPINAGGVSTASLGLIGQTGILNFANGRVYAIKASGCSSDAASCATGGFSCASSHCTSSAFRAGWPVKIGIIDAGLLPDVGEGINGAPIVAPISCPQGGSGLKVGVTPDAGPGYVLNTDGSSCYGSTNGAYNALSTDFSAGNGKTDTPAFPAVGEPAFGTLDGTTTNMFAPAAGLVRALDVAASDYQKGGQDFIAGVERQQRPVRARLPGRRQRPLVHHRTDDRRCHRPGAGAGGRRRHRLPGSAGLQRLRGAGQHSVAKAHRGLARGDADPRLAGHDRHELRREEGRRLADPLGHPVGLLDPGVGLLAELVAELPPRHRQLGRLHARRDPPGRALNGAATNHLATWTAPGGDLMCGTVTSYRIVTSAVPITPQTFAAATPLTGAPAPVAPGGAQIYALPAGTQRYIAVRAVDEQNNIGLPVVLDTQAASGGGTPGPGGGSGPGGGTSGSGGGSPGAGGGSSGAGGGSSGAGGGGSSAGGGGSSAGGGKGAACAAFAPQSGFGPPSVHRRRVVLSGRSVDRSCHVDRITRVLVSVSRRQGHSCRFLQRSGRLTRARSCNRPLFLAASLKSTTPGHKAHWTLRVSSLPRRALPGCRDCHRSRRSRRTGAQPRRRQLPPTVSARGLP